MLALMLLTGSVLVGFGFWLGQFLGGNMVAKIVIGYRTWKELRKAKRIKETFKQMGIELAINQAQAAETHRLRAMKQLEAVPEETDPSDDETAEINVLDLTATAGNTKKGEN